MRVIRTCAAAIVALVVFAACASTTAQPGYICTDAAGEYIRCTKESQDAQRAARLEAEAKEVYQRFWNEIVRLTNEGGAMEATNEMKATLAEPLLGDLEAMLQAQYEEQVKPEHMEGTLVFKEVLTDAHPDAVISIVGCEDTTGLFKNSAGEETGRGVRNLATRHFKRAGDTLKIFETEPELVETCG